MTADEIMSQNTPIRPNSSQNPPSYDAIGQTRKASTSRRYSTLPSKKHVHMQVQHASLNQGDPRRSMMMRQSMIPEVERVNSRLLPAIITPVPLETRGGYFIPDVSPVLVPPRVVTQMADRIEESDVEEGCRITCCETTTARRTFQAVLLGQMLSLCLCGTGVSSQLLAGMGFNAPAAQSFFNYFFLFFVYGLVLMFRSGDKNLCSVLRKRGWKYFLLAIIDVEANYMIVYAYQHTNLTSIQILDCSTIPVVMILSWLFLSVRYLFIHLVGVSICLAGIGLIIFADSQSGRGAEGGSDRLLGDLLCLGAALFYGAANVTEEFLVKQYDRFEYLGIVGLFGCLISSVQLAIFERESLTSFNWNLEALLYCCLFTVCMFAFYSMVSIVMQKSSALMFNLSVLTADFYTLLAGIYIFSYKFDFLYLLSFFVVITGSLIFSARKTEEKSRAETDCVANVFCFCCPWICQCCDGLKPRPAYTVREAEQERSSLGAPESEERTPSL
uniref:Solute carrier family 35 member F1 n=2 Tax=Bursaphelenchus xylophilus TaxID=6326 RepID=A0A1I7S1W7_BURXY